MDPNHLFFNVPDDRAQGNLTVQLRFAQNITNTVEEYHPATVIEGWGQENHTAAAGTSGWAVPLDGPTPSHLDALTSKDGAVAVGPAPAVQARYRHVQAGSNMPPPSFITVPPSMPQVYIDHTPLASWSTHSPVPHTPNFLDNHYYTLAAPTGYLVPAPSQAQAATHYAQQNLPSEKAWGKQRADLVETEPVQARESFENATVTPEYTAHHGGHGPLGTDKRGWDQGGDRRGFKKARQADRPVAGPSFASISAHEHEAGEDDGYDGYDTDQQVFPDDSQATAGGVVAPPIKKRTRTGGHCPFCGLWMTRKCSLRSHFGRGQICKDLYLGGQGIVKYSLDDLTHDQIAVAGKARRIEYNSTIQPPLVGPGEIARLECLEKRALRKQHQPSHQKRQPPRKKHRPAAPSLYPTSPESSNTVLQGMYGNYTGIAGRLIVNQNGQHNLQQHVPRPDIVVDGCSFQNEQNTATEWEIRNTEPSDVPGCSEQRLTGIYHSRMTAPHPVQEPNPIFPAPKAPVIEDAQGYPLSCSPALELNYASIQEHVPCGELSNISWTAYPYTRIPPSPSFFGSEEIQNVSFDFRFSSEISHLPAASSSSVDNVSGEVETAFDDLEAPWGQLDQLSTEQLSRPLHTASATDGLPNHGAVVEALRDFILDPDFVLPSSGTVL